MVVRDADPVFPTARRDAAAVMQWIRPISVYASEVREMAGLSLAADDGCEIGGSVFGSLTPGGALLVHLSVPHGPQATCRPSYFEDDPAHVLGLDHVLNERFGLRWLGTFHLHPGVNGEPSGTDERQVRRSSTKNGRRIGLQIITNLIEFEWPAWGWGFLAKRQPKVRFSNHLYFDAPAGLHTRVPLRLLPGVSPIRQVLMGDPSWEEERLGWHWAAVGMDRVVVHQLGTEEAASWRPTAVLPVDAEPNEPTPMRLTLEDF